MALCFTHAAAGYLVYEAARPAGAHRVGLLAAAVVLANAPDLDFLPGVIAGAPGVFHRGVTHTVAAALVVGVVAAGLGWWRRPAGYGARWWAAFAATAYASHLLVDFVTVDAVAPYGARFLWPASARFFHAGSAWFDEIVIDPSSRMGFLRSLVTPAALLTWLGEIARAGVAVAAVLLVRALGRSRLPQFAE
jgi:membrane-bound metal-dependent hydrolase YbcI (DUF457 family)